ncbi:MAG: hypothetical protein ACUVWN_17865 [bacterium]
MKNLKLLSIFGVLGIITILLINFWIGCGNDTPSEPEMSYSSAPPSSVFESVTRILEKHTEKLMENPGVVGTGIGVDKNNNLAIYILTEKPGVGGLPKQLDSVPVIIEVSGRFEALNKLDKKVNSTYDRTAWYRPAPIGVSTGHPNITAGTIGCRLKDNNGRVFALSNNHVYADENRAKIGDNVLQPGPYDGGTYPADAIGTLSAFKPIVFSTKAKNDIDAAVALSSTDNIDKSTLPDSYGTPKSTIVDPSIGMQVMKDGRTTALTYGKIYLFNATVNVQYDSGTARFIKQILVTPGTFSHGGDSGSLVVTKGDRKPVALVFAGSSTLTVANPIRTVLNYFNLKIDGE